MRLVFMGSSEFALPALEALVNSDHEILEVITQPDRAKGRGYRIGFTPVKEFALKNGLPLYQPENINIPEAQKHLRELAPEVMIVVAFGQILSQKILDLPTNGCINLHPSLLPKYRGAAPVQWSILNGEAETGVTTIFMNEKMDAGDIILQDKVPIDPEDTLGSLEKKLAHLGAQLLLQTLDKIEKGTVKPVAQNHSEATFAPTLKKEDCKIAWDQPAKKVKNLIRATNPEPGAYTYYRNKLLKIWKAEIIEGQKDHAPGKIIEIIKNRGFCVATGGGALLISEVQPEGKRKMSAAEFLAGHRLQIGEFLGH